MPPITILHLRASTTKIVPHHRPLATPYNPLAVFQSNQSSTGTIQTITFGILGILFAVASVFLAYLQLRQMHRSPSLPLSVVQPADQTSGML